MTAIDGVPDGLGRAALEWLAGTWRMVRLGALLLVLLLSPSSYQRRYRRALAHQLYLDTAPNLFWFTVLSALISTVLIRIVIVTALSYGLSRYALEMVVRVLVLELIPLTAALFVAMRCTIPNGAQIAVLRSVGGFDAPGPWGIGLEPLVREALPRIIAGIFSVLMLAAVNCVLTLVLAYLSAYGFSRWGAASYTRTVGQVFSPDVALIFVLKVVFSSVAVALIPIASVLTGAAPRSAAPVAELQGQVRMFVVILLIEALCLIGNYY